MKHRYIPIIVVLVLAVAMLSVHNYRQRHVIANLTEFAWSAPLVHRALLNHVPTNATPQLIYVVGSNLKLDLLLGDLALTLPLSDDTKGRFLTTASYSYHDLQNPLFQSCEFLSIPDLDFSTHKSSVESYRLYREIRERQAQQDASTPTNEPAAGGSI